MTVGDLDTFVSRSRRILERSGSLTPRETELRLVLPFLAELGWDVHGRDVVPDHTVEDDGDSLAVDFALRVNLTPAVFVVTGTADDDLSAADGRRLTGAMGAADVDWGLATNGRSYAFLTRTDGEIHRVECDLGDLPDEAAVLAHYAKEAAVERYEERTQGLRTDVASTLAEDRAALVDAVHEALVTPTAPGAIDDELRVAGERFVDGVLSALAAGDRPTAWFEADTADDSPSSTALPASTDHTGGDAHADADVAAPSDGDGEDATRKSAGDPTEGSDESEDTEYVVRFFNGRSSVGAIGHSTVGGAMAGALEYLIEQHALDSRLDLPWGPGNGRALVNREPVHPNGAEMDDPHQLSNGYFVETAIGAKGSKAAVETLADRSGLTVMFRGDWP